LYYGEFTTPTTSLYLEVSEFYSLRTLDVV
jgi:hypothetical protein